ncbi:VTC domain-containing protein [Phycomyces blakesleeanus]|uniref:VTC domain-containing protein n=1 Tax=Phycomyces blakesleeanus TaxID=4837 RepID=A0ABR3B7Z7_PHYBL
MKFGSQLKETIYPEWQAAYLDYDGLKKKLRKAEKDRPFTEKDETEFVEMLDSNLEKVYAFHKEKMEEIRRNTDEAVETAASQIPSHDSVEEMGRIQGHINEIADDINRLSRFSRLNYTGFLKIVKKHDRHTNYVLRPMFMVRLNQCPFWNEDNDALLIKLSELFSKIRDGGRTMSFQPASELRDAMEVRVDGRRTVVKRFFVQSENVLELKTYILRHLPVLVYRDASKQQANIDPPISSLYFDDADFDSYNSRVETALGSQIIRLRWYGSAKGNSSIAFERRTLAEENRGELKDRFVIKDKYIAGFLKGEQIFIEKTAKKMRKMAGKSEEEVQKFEQLVHQVQDTVMSQQMQPVLRTFYKRTAFQIPGDNSVRMALDTDLCFIREDSNMFPNDNVVRRGENDWRRPDVDTNFPFQKLKDGEISRAPFATFEIKLDLGNNEKEPDWVTELQDIGILEEAFEFSKFVHGIAVIFDSRVSLLPYWLAQIDDDDTKQLPVLPSQSPSVVKGSHSHKGKGRALLDQSPEEVRVHMEYPEPSERTSLLRNNQPSSSYSSAPISPPKDQPESVLEKIRNWPEHIGQSFHHMLSQDKPKQTREPVVLPPGVRVPKKVITPLRVEPKVFFANERTYFSWMSFGTLLSTFSIALFNAGDTVGKVSGIVYTLVSLSTLIYGMGLYYRRRELIRARAAGPYDDVMGPTVICFALLFAVGLNAYLKFTVKGPSLFYL